jgi:hypothetical protein
MIRIGKIVGTFVGQVWHGSKSARHLQIVYAGGGQDVKTTQMMLHAGVDANPINTGIAFVAESGESMRFAIATEDFIPKTAREGEYEIFSSNINAKRARVKCKATGTLYIASVANGVDLKTALSNLIAGIQGATCGGSGSPLADTTGKISLALFQLGQLLDASE